MLYRHFPFVIIILGGNMYEFDNLENEYEIVINKPKNNLINKIIEHKKIVLIVLGIIIIFILFVILIKNVTTSRYVKMEKKLVNAAKKYVNDNDITVNKEIYLNSKRISVELDDDCLLTSGVIYDGKNYTPYLECKRYESKIYDKRNNYIELKGQAIMVIPKGITYYEPGYRSREDIEIVGEVGTEEGLYNIVYVDNKTNTSLYRKVIVIDDEELYELFPKITLKGNYVTYVEQYGEYTDEGVEVTDIFDNDIESKVQIDNGIDISVEGEYNYIYQVENSKGYSTSVIRKVNVVRNLGNKKVMYTLVPKTETGSNVTIIISINDDNYEYIELPSGKRTRNKYITYEVSENANYNFIIHEKDGSEKTEVVNVSNIKKEKAEGECKVTWKSDYTQIEVNMNNAEMISSYEYIIDGKKELLSISKSYKSTTIKPKKVNVKVKDNYNNTTTLNCEIEDKSVPEIVTDARGKNCLEGHVCYVQYDYGNWRYPYCSMPENPNSCGGIGRNGCSITSTSIAIANLGVRSKNGELYNPFTVWEELYPIDKSTGECSGGCSAWTRMRDAIINAGLSAPKSYEYFVYKENWMQEITEHLKKGYPVIVYARESAYTDKGHYMALIAVRDDNYVFLSDPALPEGGKYTEKKFYKGKQYYADTWIPISDLITGDMNSYLLVGPPGYF